MDSATTRAFNSISDSDRTLGDPTAGGNPNYLNALVPNPFAGLLPGTSLDSATVTRQQLLRPFPQFTGGRMQRRTLNVAVSD